MHQRLSRTPLTIGAAGGVRPPPHVLAAAALSERTTAPAAYAVPAMPGPAMPEPPAETTTAALIPSMAPQPPTRYPVEDFFRQAERATTVFPTTAPTSPSCARSASTERRPA